MKRQSRVFWIVSSCTVLWLLFMRPYTPENIVAFELAYSTETASGIIQEWGETGLKSVRISIYLDFIFLILYAWSIGLGCRISADFSGLPLFIQPAVFFNRAVWFAGTCDFIENTFMLFTLSHMNEFSVSMAYYFAIIKFLILAIALMFVLFATAVGLFRYFYSK